MNTVKIKINVNDADYSFEVPVSATLLDVIREKLGFKGTKRGCDSGQCGACTVIMDGKSVNSCCILAVQADGKAIKTIEYLSQDGNVHPIQQAFVDENAIQCGFCTPGMIMSAKALLDENSNPNENEIKEALSGNICRCTGYTKIENAVKKSAQAVRI